jgi:proteasome assembly chaperone (PAC2) family protein
MLAAWPGISNVAMIVATYLAKKLEFKELATVQADYFFEPVGVLATDSVIEAPQFPQSQFFYWKNSHGDSDLILFLGESQPSVKSYELANSILDIGLKFRVSRIYTCAAALTRIHHTEQPRVWGAGTNQAVTEELARINLVMRGNIHISGLNGLLMGVAKERGMDGVCLLGEVPSYATKMHNPIAALAIIKTLTSILGIKIDTGELAQMANDTREKMKQLAAEAMEEYIDYFTEPIWERSEGFNNEA